MKMKAHALRDVALDDKYAKLQGPVLLTGIQALVRLTILQRELDRRGGLNTAGYVSGYRGSPLGIVDLAMWEAKPILEANNVHFVPGVNEELAATSVWGTQKLAYVPDPTVDGVYAFWYGKGPGVDRAGDAFRHANQLGMHKNGGVLVCMGDDHLGKSSSISHHTEQTIAAHWMPVLFPSDVSDIIHFGLLGWAMSRYSGCMIGFKLVGETAEQAATVDFDLDNFHVERPPYAPDVPLDRLHFTGAYAPMLTEVTAKRYRLPLAQAFARANRIDRLNLGNASARLGIVTAGKAYHDVRQALRYLGIGQAEACAMGLAVYKVGLISPLEPAGLREFSAGKDELLFIEEKSGFMEPQAAALLYNLEKRPRIVGKKDERGEMLIPPDLLLEPRTLAETIAQRLQVNGLWTPALAERLAALKTRTAGVIAVTPASGEPARIPFYCSGCPHNTSTTVPEGSMAFSGIGCHGMAVWSKPGTRFGPQMGGEGMDWVGLSRFTKTKHAFQNLGEGTYYHSGYLAIRAAIASGANITYKILYNDAVAMTGGQPVDGPISVSALASQLVAEGVKTIILVSDDPTRYAGRIPLPQTVEVEHRDRIAQVQDRLRNTPGCSVMIYEQTCAAEKRRRRKRGDYPTPDERLFIAEAVCEGCGDCSTQSNCISVEPLETELGRKRQINQSSCNLDFSCVKGFCPSYLTVHGATLKKRQAVTFDARLLAQLPEPVPAALTEGSFGIMVAGIGGTGVVTVGAILAMAAHMEGKGASSYDMMGMAQKNGAVFSHLRITAAPDSLPTPRIGTADAALVLGFDMVAATTDDAFRTLSAEHTRFIGNTPIRPTWTFIRNPDATIALEPLVRKIRRVLPEDQMHLVDAEHLAIDLLGDAIATNMFMVGVAAQLGWLPIGRAAIEQAIRLNGVQVEFNLRAFALGRLWVANPRAVEQMRGDGGTAQGAAAPLDLAQTVADRVQRLTDYHDASYAARYRALVERVAQAEARISAETTLSLTVARQLARLMMIKDEYEVARLLTSPELMAQINAQFDGVKRISYNLSPPILAAAGLSKSDTGIPVKRRFGPWLKQPLTLLARWRGLRETRWDIFGRTTERRLERQIRDDFIRDMADVAATLKAETLAHAQALAELPSMVRGFGHVKLASISAYQEQRSKLLAAAPGTSIPNCTQKKAA